MMDSGMVQDYLVEAFERTGEKGRAAYVRVVAPSELIAAPKHIRERWLWNEAASMVRHQSGRTSVMQSDFDVVFTKIGGWRRGDSSPNVVEGEVAG